MSLKILQKDDKYIRMIPNGITWTKVVGSVMSKKERESEEPITRWVNEYKTHIEAGYIDQTDIFISVKEPVNFFAIKDEKARNVYKALYDTCEMYTSRVFEKTHYTRAQIYLGEQILNDMKAAIDDDREFGRNLAKFYNTMFKKISPLCMERKDKNNILSEEFEALNCLKSQLDSYMPEIRCISENEYEIFNKCTKKDQDEYKKQRKGQMVTMYHSSPDICWYSILNTGLVATPPKMLHGNAHGDGIYFTKKPNDIFSDKYYGAFEVYLTNDNHNEYLDGYYIVKDAMAVNQVKLIKTA